MENEIVRQVVPVLLFVVYLIYLHRYFFVKPEVFKWFKIPFMAFLCLFTSGAHILYWYSSISRELRSSQSADFGRFPFAATGLLILVVHFPIVYAENFSIKILPENLESVFHNGIWLLTIGLYLVWAFAIKKEIEKKYSTTLNPWYTAIFGCLYLQHSINKEFPKNGENS